MSSRIKPIEAVLRSGATVFALSDLGLLWHETKAHVLRDKVKYYVDNGRLLRLRKGIYALSHDYEPYELAQKLIRPSYISLESALSVHGVIHQYSSIITCIAPYPRVITVDNRTYRYHALKGDLLSCPMGIHNNTHYAMATPERALCDSLYLGFQPDIEGSYRWDTALLACLQREFATPRVSKGLSSLLSSL